MRRVRSNLTSREVVRTEMDDVPVRDADDGFMRRIPTRMRRRVGRDAVFRHRRRESRRAPASSQELERRRHAEVAPRAALDLDFGGKGATW